MSNKNLAVFENHELEKIAEQKSLEKKSLEILEHINNISQRIKDAKDDAERVENMKSGGIFGGKTKKKIDETARALVRVNEAVAEMHTLIQEAVKFTCQSIVFSKVMIQVISQVIAKGFRDCNGDTVKLIGDGEKFAKIILSQADEFINKHLEIQNLQEEQQNNLKNLQEHSDERDEELEQEISRLQEESDRKDANLFKEIYKKTAQVLATSDEKDALHDQQIGELQQTTSDILSKSNTNDQKHDQQLKELFERTNLHTNKIQEIKRSKIAAIWLPIISLLLSIIAIVLTMIDL